MYNNNNKEQEISSKQTFIIVSNRCASICAEIEIKAMRESMVTLRIKFQEVLALTKTAEEKCTNFEMKQIIHSQALILHQQVEEMLTYTHSNMTHKEFFESLMKE